MECSRCKSGSVHSKVIHEDDHMILYIKICNTCGYEEDKVRYKVYYN